MGRYLHRKKLVRIKVQRVLNLLISSIFKEVFIDLPGKSDQVQLVYLKLQKTGCFKGRKLFRLLLINQADALEAMVAFLSPLKNTAAGAQPSQLLILLEHQKVVLQLVQLPLRVNSVNAGHYHMDIWIILPVQILIPHLAVLVHMKGKGHLPVFKGRQPLRKYPAPHIVTPVLADNTHMMKQVQVLLFYGKAGVNPNGLTVLIEISGLDLITAAHRADRIQN